MEIRAIRCVLAVAETLHFGRASEQLRISQPALSRQVQALEREIGVDLFDRTSRSVELTAAGAQFVPLTRKALEILDVAADQARESARGQVGQVRLGFVATAAINILPRLLAMHRSQRPRVSVSLTECTSGEQIEALRNGLIDVALGRDLPPTSGVRVTVFRTEDYVAAVPLAHPLAGRAEVSIHDLAGLPLVRLPPGVARRADALLALVEASAISGQIEATDVQHAHQYMTLLALVAAGTGVALVPESVTALRSDGVCYVNLQHADATSALTVATRSDDRSPVVRDLRAMLLSIDLA
ncbi:MAG: LysR family transcriptional regulator [Allobranchiibius sp.]